MLANDMSANWLTKAKKAGWRTDVWSNIGETEAAQEEISTKFDLAKGWHLLAELTWPSFKSIVPEM